MKDTFFRDKVVVITGASSGIGLALAKQFAASGANLVLGARRFVQLCEIAAQLGTEHGIRAVAVSCDVSQEEDCKLLVAQAHMSFNRIDVLINNAGVSMHASFSELHLDVLKRVMEVNFWGTVYCSKHALPLLLAANGSLVAVSSVAGYMGLPGKTGYSASKFAIRGLMESLRLENRSKGLHVLLACPGFTASNIHKTAYGRDVQQIGDNGVDESRMMSAEEVAGHILKAIARRKRSIVLSSQGKLAVFLNKFFPAWVDKQIYRMFSK